MDYYLGDKSKYFIVAVTTGAAMFSFAFSAKIPVPSQNYQIEPKMLNKYSYEDILINPYYSLSKAEHDTIQQIEIIHKFVSNVLTNIKDLEPSIGKIISKNFWKMT